MKTTFYIGHINNIGGVESWIYYIAQLYGEGRDITLYYSELAEGAENQLERLAKYIKVRKYYGQKVKTDLAVFCYNTTPIANFIAKEKIYFVHGVFSNYGYKTYEIPNEIDKVFAVSKVSGDDFKKLTGRDYDIMYNPMVIEKPRKVLKLISATRISKDKGSIWERMRILAKKLNEADIPFIWLVFTNNKDIKPDIKGVVFVPSDLSITSYIAEADYLVQLSTSEAYSYSVNESLSLGTPVLVTNFPTAIEMGVVDGKNGYIFNMEMDNVDVQKIYNKIPKFTYEPKNSDKEWKKLLGPKGRKKEKDELVKVQCIKMEGFREPQTGKWRKYKEKWECSLEDAEYMINYNNPNSFTNGPLVDIIE